MISLIGRGLILAAVGLAAAAGLVGLQAGASGSAQGEKRARQLAAAFAWCLIGANVVMEYALLTRDFTVRYVDQVGSHDVPDYIAFVSLWSALEGSILFWGFILGVYVLGFLRTVRRPEHRDLSAYAVGVLSVVSCFFAFLIAGPADPFGAVTPAPVHAGPNPLLQNHALMIVHPPMLYLGYVGMTVPFAMGVAALLRGRLGASWMAPMRRWMLVPWGFLSAGIVLGGWWAYEVLGWGGYWAWDPVENASLLPWLAATGFLHAAMLQERRGLLKGWTIVLVLLTFALTILGTFMTRSGVFNSVHSFTQSPIGPTFLLFLAAVLVVGVVLVALRAHLLEPEGEFRSPLSREVAFVANNLLFVAFTVAVLVGTVFPLIAEAVRDVKVSVGVPYFNALTVPIAVLIVFMMGVGPALPWGRATPREAAEALALPAGAGVVVAGIAFALGIRDGWPVLAWFVSAFAATVALRDLVRPVLAVQRRQGGGMGTAAIEAVRRGHRRMGGQIVHLGIAVLAVSVATSWTYQQTAESVLRKDAPLQFGGYELRFEGRKAWQEPHRQVVAADIGIWQDGKQVGTLSPRMNRYTGQMAPIGTPAVWSGPTHDLYLSAMQIDDGGAFVGLRAFHNPLIVWIWVGAGILVLGCALALAPLDRKRAEAA